MVFCCTPKIDCSNSTSLTIAGFAVVVVVVVVVVDVVVVELGTTRRRELDPAFSVPPPNCCVIVGKSFALTGRPRSVDSNNKSLLIVSMSFLPFSISDFDSVGFSIEIEFEFIEFGDDSRVGRLFSSNEFTLPVRLRAN